MKNCWKIFQAKVRLNTIATVFVMCISLLCQVEYALNMMLHLKFIVYASVLFGLMNYFKK